MSTKQKNIFNDFTVVILFFFGMFFCVNSFAQEFTPNTPSLYHKDWIDFNKNGVKDVYEDSTQLLEKRVEDLLSQMTLEEKTNQMATLYGFGRVLQDSLPTPEWKNEIWKDGLANIDEHLNGYVKRELPLSNDLEKHIWGMNKTQEFFVEETRLGIPVDFTNEGIRGVEAYGVTDFPAQLALGNTWNKELIYKVGQITAQEARALGYTNVYAPILDVARDQRWGRLEESYGESPYLVAELGTAMAQGMQKDRAVASTAKHFALYSANFGAREGMARTDPQIPLREAYTLLTYPFERVIKKVDIKGIMSSYNDYDGEPITGSHFWLTQKLRQEYGFSGYVVSDSDALEFIHTKHKIVDSQEDAVAMAVNAGLNVRTNFDHPKTMILPLREAVKKGKVSMATLDDRVRDVLRVKFWLGLFDEPYIHDTKHSKEVVRNPQHLETALQASHESLVLLKNEEELLPLSKNLKSVAVIGPNAKEVAYVNQRYGPHGISPVSVYDGIKNKLGNAVQVTYEKGVDLVDKTWPESEVFPTQPDANERKEMDKAVALAKASEVAVLVMGNNPSTEGENRSRTSLDLPGHQTQLIQEVVATGTPTIVVFINTLPITFNWVDRYVPAILEAWYPGEQGGTAIADVLFGDYNPGGKLTLTFPRSVGQLPMNFPSKPNAQSDVMDIVRLKGKLYPFGYGLSYTTFEYTDLEVTPKERHKEGNVNVSFNLTNTGDYAGDEIVQLYIHQKVSSVTTYENKLRGFDRVHLKPGETKKISFTLTPDDLSIWNKHNQFVVEPGAFEVMIGASSEDIKLKKTFTLK